MNKVIDGGLYALGALIVCTIWSVIALAFIGVGARQAVQNAVDAQAASDRNLLEYGPDNDVDRARLLELKSQE